MRYATGVGLGKWEVKRCCYFYVGKQVLCESTLVTHDAVVARRATVCRSARNLHQCVCGPAAGGSTTRQHPCRCVSLSQSCKLVSQGAHLWLDELIISGMHVPCMLFYR